MKKILCLGMLLFVLLFFVSCKSNKGTGEMNSYNGSDPSSSAETSWGEISVTDTDSLGTQASFPDSSVCTQSSGQESISNTETEDFISEENLVMACDQLQERIVLYDLDLLDPGDPLEYAEIWSLDCGYAAGLKYRENTVFGDVVLVAGETSGIYAYPSGNEIWTTTNPGINPHSIEILPGGNIVIANSTGATVRLFQTSELKNGNRVGSQSYVDYDLIGAHGVLWDPEYEVLWALGDDELVAYMVWEKNGKEVLESIPDMGIRLPENGDGGHDLSADLTDIRYLYLTVNSRVYRFDKEEGTLDARFSQYNKLTFSSVKGFGNNRGGNFFYVYPNGGIGTSWEHLPISDWCTDRIQFCLRSESGNLYKKTFKAETSAFYKCRVFYGGYQ